MIVGKLRNSERKKNAVWPLIRNENGQAQNGKEIASVVLCPYSFDGSPKLNSYLEANNLIEKGTNLGDVVPKSTTIVHELFHALLGDTFLSDDDEKYDIAACINLANTDRASAQSNPENYVFFIANMYHMFGGEDGDESWSIKKQWEFKTTDKGKNRIFGAFETEQTSLDEEGEEEEEEE
ncbi:hypothetical protein C8A03DRAFT_35239 [Achaetomium macrosporum]|uniref:Uncharacterized protein n=1 Tax=Achaetomium macrosporum TaxID=79813 RepID=A0AAN7C7H3_9PEZI|nr:hypothetical protein C8A03DRAFT_35239 [Achaetomium macrosporum]